MHSISTCDGGEERKNETRYKKNSIVRGNVGSRMTEELKDNQIFTPTGKDLFFEKEINFSTLIIKANNMPVKFKMINLKVV
jgi:hypothetical protein